MQDIDNIIQEERDRQQRIQGRRHPDETLPPAKPDTELSKFTPEEKKAYDDVIRGGTPAAKQGRGTWLNRAIDSHLQAIEDAIVGVLSAGEIAEGFADETLGATGRNVVDMIAEFVPIWAKKRAKEMGIGGKPGDAEWQWLEGKYDELVREFPMFMGVYDEFVNTFGSAEAIARAWDEDPARITTVVLPILKRLQMVKGGSFAAKTARQTGQIAGWLNPDELPEHTIGALGTAIAKWKNRGLAKSEYNPEFSAVYGRDMDTAENLTVEQTPKEMGERIGLTEDDIPALGLSDNPTVHHNEMIRQQTAGDAGEPVTRRFERTRSAIEGAQEDFVDRAKATATLENSGDVEAVGKFVSQLYVDWQMGMKSDFRKKFNTLGTVLDQEITDKNFKLLAKTQAELERIKSNRSRLSKRSPRSIELAESILTEAFEALSQDGLTIRDFDLYRTEFRQRFEDAMSSEGLKPLGSGSPVSRLYMTLTEDFYDLIENEVDKKPDAFPSNFMDSVKLAKREYREVMLLEETKAAKIIRDNQEAPHKIINCLLSHDTSRKVIEDMKKIIGDEGWQELQTGLMIRFFDMVSGTTRDYRWGGLYSEIQKINKTDKNRLRLIFGDETAKELSALGEFGLRFSKEARWTKGTPTGFINKLVQGTGFLDLLQRVTNVLPLGTIPWGAGRAGMGHIHPVEGVAVAGTVIAWFGQHRWEQFLNSDRSRKWLLEGHTWEIVRKDGSVVVVTPEHFKTALQNMNLRKHTAAARIAGRTKRYKEESIDVPPIRRDGGNPFLRIEQ